jgi:fermentation-respiration switch protein FrsA (DUF1100 family)
LLVACGRPVASDAEIESYRERAGTLVRAETSASVPRGRYALSRLRLTSTTGLVATGRLLRPDTGRCYPAVLLQNGREENSAVIGRLPAEFGDVVVLSLDYPDEMPMVIQLRDVVQRERQLQRAASEIPSTFLLGAAYLAQRSDVDSSRIALAATSFAVPFSTIAAAADERFREVALIYGAGELSQVLAANLALKPEFLRGPAAWLAMRPFAAFAPERFIGHIAPRPIIMVNGSDDPQMPVDAVQALYEAAKEPKAQVWMRTGHLMPTDSTLIRALVDTALARMTVLDDSRRQAGATEGCREVGNGGLGSGSGS